MDDKIVRKPMTVETMIEQLTRLLDKYHDDSIPYDEAITPTHTFILDLCERLVALEDRLNNGI
jgi:hypothetical protein